MGLRCFIRTRHMPVEGSKWALPAQSEPAHHALWSLPFCPYVPCLVAIDIYYATYMKKHKPSSMGYTVYLFRYGQHSGGNAYIHVQRRVIIQRLASIHWVNTTVTYIHIHTAATGNVLFISAPAADRKTWYKRIVVTPSSLITCYRHASTGSSHSG